MGRFGPGAIVPFKLIFYRILIKIHKEFICHVISKISVLVLPFVEFLLSVFLLSLTFRFSKKATKNRKLGDLSFLVFLEYLKFILLAFQPTFL